MSPQMHRQPDEVFEPVGSRGWRADGIELEISVFFFAVTDRARADAEEMGRPFGR